MREQEGLFAVPQFVNRPYSEMLLKKKDFENSNQESEKTGGIKAKGAKKRNNPLK